MVSFSEMLSQLMEERDIRVFDLARYLGADRSSVYKIVRGTRTPSNRKMVERIADYLCLGHAEKSDLIDSYYYTILKPNHYFASKQIVGLFNRLGQEPGVFPLQRLQARKQFFVTQITITHCCSSGWNDARNRFRRNAQK